MTVLVNSDGSVMSTQKVVSQYPLFALEGEEDLWTDDSAITSLRQRELEWSYGLMPICPVLAGDTAEAKLLSIYDVLDSWFRRDDYEACVIVSMVIEMLKHEQLSQDRLDYISCVREMVAKFAEELHLVDPTGFVLAWRLLMKGAVLAAMEGERDAPLRAKQMAHALVRSHAPANDLDSYVDYELPDLKHAGAVPVVSGSDGGMTDLDSTLNWLEYGEGIEH
jgi:hypothetical protein